MFLANSSDINVRRVLSNATSYLANDEQLELVNGMSHSMIIKNHKAAEIRNTYGLRDNMSLTISSQHCEDKLKLAPYKQRRNQYL